MLGIRGLVLQVVIRCRVAFHKWARGNMRILVEKNDVAGTRIAEFYARHEEFPMPRIGENISLSCDDFSRHEVVAVDYDYSIVFGIVDNLTYENVTILIVVK